MVAAWPVLADLTAVITPGYTFSANEIPTTGKLNLLGQPVIQIFGTVGGSNGIAANSINGTMLFSGVVDGTTLDFNGASPRQIEVAASGVGKTQLNTNVAGAGLSGGAGSAIALLVDTTNFVFNGSNQVTLNFTNWGPTSNTLLGTVMNADGTTNTNRVIALGQGLQIPRGTLIVSNLALSNLNWQTFMTSSIAITAGMFVNVAHTLTNAAGASVKPTIFRASVVCISADANYAVGDEVDTTMVISTGGSSTPGFPIFFAGDNTTNVFLTMTTVNPVIWAKNGVGGFATFTPTKWQAKLYASVQ